MLKVDDPQSWLDAPSPPGWAEPRTPWDFVETLHVGDVQADGTILWANGVSQVSGCAMVTVGQSHAAAYYGWHMSGLRFLQNGVLYTQIYRDDPACSTI